MDGPLQYAIYLLTLTFDLLVSKVQKTYLFNVLLALQMIDREMQKADKCKQQRLTVKSQVDDFESQVNEIKKRLNAQNKEIAAVQKQISAMETKLEQKRADRHSLLKTCKVTGCILLDIIISYNVIYN